MSDIVHRGGFLMTDKIRTISTRLRDGDEFERYMAGPEAADIIDELEVYCIAKEFEIDRLRAALERAGGRDD